MPDDYRGAFRRDDKDAGLKYGRAVGEALEKLRDAVLVQPELNVKEKLLPLTNEIN